MSASDTAAAPSPLGRSVWWLVLAALALHAPGLAGPLTDGQRGNCDAMFGIIARNTRALGSEGLGVPSLNPVPPVSVEQADWYTHHPPGLAWAVTAASSIPAVPYEPAARAVALLLTLAAAWLLADLVARLTGRALAGMAAGLLMLGLPAGYHHGLLVNYETVALPALLFLLRSLMLQRGGPLLAGVLAGLADWIALLPLALVLLPGFPRHRNRWLQAALGGALGLGLTVLPARRLAPSSFLDTLAQALGASFAAPDFRTGPWLAALSEHATNLFGWALIPAGLALVLLRRTDPACRRLTLALLAVGVFNVTVFARHATGHEHYSLLLLPFVAASIAVLLFGSRRLAPTLPLLILTALLGLSAWQGLGQAPERNRTAQSDLAARFADLTTEEHIYVRPEGASLVFLYGARRHVVPFPAASPTEAGNHVRAFRKRFGVEDRPGRLFLVPGDAVPAWVEELPSVRIEDGFRFYDLALGG